MPVHVIANSSAALTRIRAMLGRRYPVTSELLGGIGMQRSEIKALVIKTDLRIIENISALKKIFDTLEHVQIRIFLVDDNAHLSVSQAYALGATAVLVGPLSPPRLLAELGQQLPGDGASTSDTSDAAATASAGEVALACMFSAVAIGAPIDFDATRTAGNKIADCVRERGLSDWLTTVRRHHEGTYQHCLLVTGVAVDFGLSLGVSKSDIERLYMAAMFHDIGKAKIPLAVLDKPGRLDPHERALIETHPVAGYDVLKDNEGIAGEILDAVRHHHEYLDGSGYPDGLGAENISDLVRILTISDIFAALIEARRYKSPMSREDAYGVIGGMHGKLEKPLVGAFKEVALSR